MALVKNIQLVDDVVENIQTVVHENEKNLQLLNDVMKKFQREMHGNNSTLDSTDAVKCELFSGDSVLSTSKRTLSDLMAEHGSKKLKPDFIFEGPYTVVYTNLTRPNNITEHQSRNVVDVWWGENHPLNISKPAALNAGDIEACTKACIIAFDTDIPDLLIKTNSEFVIRCIAAWIEKWHNNDWITTEGSNVQNRNHLEKLAKINKLLNVKYELVASGYQPLPEATDEVKME